MCNIIRYVTLLFTMHELATTSIAYHFQHHCDTVRITIFKGLLALNTTKMYEFTYVLTITSDEKYLQSCYYISIYAILFVTCTL